MRICRFNGGKLGLVQGDKVIDVTPVLGLLPAQKYPLPQKDLLVEALPQLRGAIEAEAKKGASYAVKDVKFESPVANPGKIIGAPINYKAHVEESKADANIGHGRSITSIGDWGMFLKAGSSLIGCSDEIVLRFPERRNDHEIELGIVIGKQGNQIKAADAMGYIAGYCVTLDMTLRGPEFQCFRKSIDSYSVAGPWLVTADEVADPDKLDLWLTVNGEARQKSNTSFLVYDVARLIEFASSFYTLMPGDIIMSGTPEGVGPVKPGDVIDCGVESIGQFSIRIAPAYA
ncbi:MAG: fumarylacetoacetate hydrolase family protein [Pseudomonadota bacterium]